MKNNRITTVIMALAICLGSWAQDEMNTVWEIGLEHQTDMIGTGLEGGISYAASDKKITVFNNEDGKILWSKPYKEIAPKLRKVNELMQHLAAQCPVHKSAKHSHQSCRMLSVRC